MSVNVFGRHLLIDAGVRTSRGPPGIGFALTREGDYDISNKRLINVAQPVHENDAITLDTLNGLRLEMQLMQTALKAQIQAIRALVDDKQTSKKQKKK